MRLQRHFARTIKGKDYFKWVVVIPPEDVLEIGWKEGIDLQIKISNNSLILSPKKHSQK